MPKSSKKRASKRRIILDENSRTKHHYGSINDPAYDCNAEDETQNQDVLSRIRYKIGRGRKKKVEWDAMEREPLLGASANGAQAEKSQKSDASSRRDQQRPPPILIHNSEELYAFMHGKLPTSPQKTFLRDTMLRRANSTPNISSPLAASHHTLSAESAAHDATMTDSASQNDNASVHTITIESMTASLTHIATDSTEVPSRGSSSATLCEKTQELDPHSIKISPSSSTQQSIVPYQQLDSTVLKEQPTATSAPPHDTINSTSKFFTSVFFPPVANVLHYERLLSLLTHTFHYIGLIFFFFCMSLFFLGVLLYDIFWLKHGGGWNDDQTHQDPSFTGNIVKFFHVVLFSSDGQVLYWHLLLFVSFAVMLGIASFFVLFGIVSLIFEVIATIVQNYKKAEAEGKLAEGEPLQMNIQQVLASLQEEDSGPESLTGGV